MERQLKKIKNNLKKHTNVCQPDGSHQLKHTRDVTYSLRWLKWAMAAKEKTKMLITLPPRWFSAKWYEVRTAHNILH